MGDAWRVEGGGRKPLPSRSLPFTLHSPPSTMKINAITVCVDYADFLEHTLPYLRLAASEITVVTSPSDRRTEAVARRYAARVVQTTAMFDEGRPFSLGAAIDAGLDRTLGTETDWVLVIDADIVLPRDSGPVLRALDLDPRGLYGIDRTYCRSWEAWDRFRRTKRQVRSSVVDTCGFEFGDRISAPEIGGYAPCGFFQLWHPRGSGVDWYPIHPAGTAEASDMLFASRWHRRERHLIPELIAVELQTPSGTPSLPGANWSGRRTPEFSREGGPYRRGQLSVVRGPSFASRTSETSSGDRGSCSGQRATDYQAWMPDNGQRTTDK
jgi:hypothetical protein